MYSWLWRRLPGPWPAKLVGLAVLLVAALALLFLVVFPRVGPALPFNHVTVDRGMATVGTVNTVRPSEGPST